MQQDAVAAVQQGGRQVGGAGMAPERKQQILLDGAERFGEFEDEMVQGRDIVVPQVVEGVMRQQVHGECQNGIGLFHVQVF